MMHMTSIMPGIGTSIIELPVIIHRPSIGFSGMTTINLDNTEIIKLTITNMVTEDFQRTSDAFSVDIEFRDLCDVALARTTVEYDEFEYNRHSTVIPIKLKEVLMNIPHDVHVLKIRARYNSAADYSSQWSNTAFLTIYGKGYPMPE